MNRTFSSEVSDMITVFLYMYVFITDSLKKYVIFLSEIVLNIC